MRRLSDQAYVLRTRLLGETDLIVHLLARDHGRVHGVARSARRSRRRFGGVLEPMTLVRLTWVEREGRDLHRIEATEGMQSHANLQADPIGLAVCAVLGEVCDTFARESHEERSQFKLLGAVLEALEKGVDRAGALRYFEYWTLRLHGLLPDLTQCSDCSAPLDGTPRVGWSGTVRCASCDAASGEEWRSALGPRELRALEEIRRRSPADASLELSVVRPGGGLERLLRGTLESFAEKKFRGYRHLRRLAGPPEETTS